MPVLRRVRSMPVVFARVVVLSLLVSVVVAAPALDAPAAASTLQTFERGTVARVVDGDTIDVDVDGGKSGMRIRLAGIQAPEIGACNAKLSTDRLVNLVQGKRVELRGLSPSSHNDGRPLRHVFVGGTDVTEQMLLDGMGLWFPLGPELSNMRRYHAAADAARSAGRGIWKDSRCGSGPKQSNPLSMWVRSDAEGDDQKNVNGEYAAITNHGSTTTRLGGWRFRLSGLKTYKLPSTAAIPAGGRHTIHVGRGTNTSSRTYLGRSSAWFRNANVSTGLGDGAYLVDPDGDIRAAFTWPHPTKQPDPLVGRVRITRVMYDPPGADTSAQEFIELKNVSTQRVRLDRYQLRLRHRAYAFRHNTTLNAGERLRITVGPGSSTRVRQFMGYRDPILTNAGDVVELLSWDERPVHCVDWGNRSCP